MIIAPAQLAATHAAAFQTDRAWSTAEFAGLLDQTGVWLIGDADCFVLARLVVDEAEILTLATHPAHQRKGRAQAALAEFHTSAHAKGAVTSFLEVAADNDPAKALYERAGYCAVGQRSGYYARKGAGAVDALILRKSLLSRKTFA